MKKVFILAVISFAIFAFSGKDIFKPVPYSGFPKGEVLDYKLTYGFLTAGKAQITIQPKTYKVNGRSCYKVDVYGRTAGALDLITKVNDNWGAYVDTAALVPHISYRNIEEGSYRKYEVVKFNHYASTAETKMKKDINADFNPPETYKIPENIRDVVGGYMYLRALDMNKYHYGDTLVIDAFFQDTVYDFKIVYKGREVIKTSMGKFVAYKLCPVMPENKLFSGKSPITLWMSVDENKIPLKIEADFVIGKASCELSAYSGVKKELVSLKK
jgi:hypothetical protein